jgi:hypothetical protein
VPAALSGAQRDFVFVEEANTFDGRASTDNAREGFHFDVIEAHEAHACQPEQKPPTHGVVRGSTDLSVVL